MAETNGLQEGLWADPELIFQLAEEDDRINSTFLFLEDQYRAQKMLESWINHVVRLMTCDQTLLIKLLGRCSSELKEAIGVSETLLDFVSTELRNRTGNVHQPGESFSIQEIEENRKNDLLALEVKECSDNTELDQNSDFEDAFVWDITERNALRREWYAEKEAAWWIVKLLGMLAPIEETHDFKRTLIATRKDLIRRSGDIESRMGFDLTMFVES